MPVWLATAVASKWFKIGLGVVALLALVFAVKGTIDTVQKWQTDTFNKAFNAGYTASDAKWEKASAENARAALASVQANIERSNTAVQNYVADIAARAPLIVPVKERTTVYAQSPDAGTVCLDADGVRLLRDYRAALGLGGQASPAAASPAAVR